jgi:hypothetical protein
MHFPITHYELLMKHMGGEFIVDIFLEKLKRRNVDFNEFARCFEEAVDSWYDIINSPLGKLYNLGNISDMNLFGRQIFHSYMMKLHGEKVYYLSRNACETLYNTRLTIDSEFIESPFEQIYMYTDQDEIFLTDHTGTMPMRGIYLSLTHDPVKNIRFIATSGSNGIEQSKDINYFATFNIPEHGSLDEIADAQMDRFMKPGSGFILNTGVDMAMLRKIFVFIVNSLLYIGCQNVELVDFKPDSIRDAIDRKKSGGKIKKLEKLIGRVAQQPFILVNPSKKHNAQELGANGKKLDHQVLVSGHWRGQWKGSEIDGTRSKEVIRIKSYLKGVGLIENKPHVIK